MLPKSMKHRVYETGRVKQRKYCLIVDNEADIAEDIRKLVVGVYPNSHVDCCRQDEAEAMVYGVRYDIFLVDSDAFRIGEHPGLDTIRALQPLIDVSKTIYLSNQKPKGGNAEEFKDMLSGGLSLIKKGQWKVLEDRIRSMLRR